MSELNLLGPLLPAGAITTLAGPPGLELLALVAGIALSVKTGREIIPGWCPASTREVTVLGYEGTWVEWRSTVQAIVDDAQIAAPMIEFIARSAPLGEERAVERDPEADLFWDAPVVAEVKATTAAARPHRLYILLGLRGATAWGGDGSMRRLYDKHHRQTVLMVGDETAWNQPSWGDGETWAGSYGPVLRLSDLRDQAKGVSDFLLKHRGEPNVIAEAPAAPESAPVRDANASANGTLGKRNLGDVNAFFDGMGVEALRAILTDGRSIESKRIKTLARAQGIGPGTLYRGAVRLRDAALARSELAFREAPSGGRPTILCGYASVFGQWRELDSPELGNYLQRIARDSFAHTIATDRNYMKCTFQHGRDPGLGYRSLGPITLLEEDGHGLRYEVELLDVDYVRELVPWLRTGLYGGSLTFEVMADDFVVRPGNSAHNPRGIPEQTLREIRVQEFGPVYPPAYAGTSAGIRLGR
jgi:phage head maturation protease